ncbi:MAG TPA: Ig-like domain-containing protein [Thiohalobacter sp.]|nr:Ig-like domain-containing protein [Thiohalobacter sp.]
MSALGNKSKQIIIVAATLSSLLGSSASLAELQPDATLEFTAAASGGTSAPASGSWFSMLALDLDSDGTPETSIYTPIGAYNGINLGTAQAASGSHSGSPGCTAGAGTCTDTDPSSESPNIDNPWGFFGNTGMHQTTSAATVLSASGNSATVDFSGWNVTWNHIASIPMGSGAWAGNPEGVATITCGVDCGHGDTFVLEYSATVPAGDPSGFGGVAYGVHLEGTIVEQVAPVANDDSTTTLINAAVTIDVLSNDTDENDNIDPTTVVATDGSNGTTSVDPVTGEITYTPSFGITGQDTFTYTVRDAGGLISNSATVTVDVSSAPAPSASDDTATTRVNTAVDIDVTANDTDLDGTVDATTVTIMTGASNGSTSVNATTGVVTYTPNPSYSGTDTFTYTVNDNDGQTSNEATVTVTINPNTAPAANDDSTTTDADTPVEINVLANDSDSDGSLDPATVTATQPSNGTTTVDTTTGRVTYTPDPGFTGTDSFTYTVDDNDGGTSNSATVTITVVSTGASGMPANATLSIDPGSNFTMEVEPGFHLETVITGFQGLKTFVAQDASGSHIGAPNGTESPGIDNPWSFFGNTGMHGTSTPARVLTATGNTATLDMSGWFVTWNGIALIPMGSDPWGSNAEGVANIICGTDCGEGDTYTLTYTATVPVGDPSGFGGVPYGLNLKGTIQVITTVDASGSTGTPVLGDGNEGGTAATGYQIAVSSLPDDPDYDPVGSGFDFSVSGLGIGGTAVVTINLGQALPEEAVYRKYTSSQGWQSFDTSGGDTLESGASVAGDCAAVAVSYSNGLTAGNDCIRLTIADGGSNDGDLSLDGSVFDPGVVAIPAAGPIVDTRTSGSSGGCSIRANQTAGMEWLLIATLLIGLGYNSRRRV